MSELVTNAISYTFGNVQMNFSDDGQQIRVEVSDGSTMSPIIREPGRDGGRGLRLVDALADRWAVESRLDGKLVWFEVSVSEHVPGP